MPTKTSTKRYSSGRAAGRRGGKVKAAGIYLHAKTGKLVKALNQAGVRLLIHRSVKEDVEAIITDVVWQHISRLAIKPKKQVKDGSKVARLIGGDVSGRGGSSADLPWPRRGR